MQMIDVHYKDWVINPHGKALYRLYRSPSAPNYNFIEAILCSVIINN